MRDLDVLLRESLRSDGVAYREVTTDPAGVFRRRYRRRRVANVLAATSLVLLAGSAAGLALHGITRPASVIAPGPDTTVVPWTEATPGEPTPLPSAAPASASTPRCRAAGLQAKFGFSVGAAGNDANVLAFANRTSYECALQGAPAVRLIRPSGEALQSEYAEGSYFPDHGRERVAVKPGIALPADESRMQPGIAMLYFTWADCDEADTAAFVEVALPGGGGSMRIAAPEGGFVRTAQPACDGNPSARGSRVEVNNFQSVEPEPVPPADYSALTATIEAPASVKAGSRLRYTVTLTNTGARDVSFDPCPAYTETIGGDGIKAAGLYLLNCVDAPTLSAGKSLTFEMFLDVPASPTNTGPGYLHWDFRDGTGLVTPKGIPITILPA
jgi:hypothetical protein